MSTLYNQVFFKEFSRVSLNSPHGRCGSTPVIIRVANGVDVGTTTCPFFFSSCPSRAVHDDVLTKRARFRFCFVPVRAAIYQKSQVKNSWGADWGMNGYILLGREEPQKGGECGILMQASYPVLV